MKFKTTLLSALTAAGLLGSAAAGGYSSLGSNDGTSLTSSQQISLTQSGGAWTPMLQQGTRELSIAGRIDLNGFDKLEYDIDFSYGYFIRDGWEIGLTGTFSDFDGNRGLNVGLFTEWNFNRDSQWVPYIRLSTEFASAKLDSGDVGVDVVDLDSILIGTELGIKYFFRPNIAITGSVGFDWSPDDILGPADDVEAWGSVINLGMRFYF